MTNLHVALFQKRRKLGIGQPDAGFRAAVDDNSRFQKLSQGIMHFSILPRKVLCEPMQLLVQLLMDSRRDCVFLQTKRNRIRNKLNYPQFRV